MKLRYWIGIAVLLILIAGGVYAFHRSVQTKPQTGKLKQSAAAIQPVYAATGEVVDTFPKGWVIGGNNVTETSYKVSYANSSQNTAVYDTTDTVAAIYQDYLSYLKKNSYNLVNNQISARGDSAQIFAIGPKSSLSVEIAMVGKSTHVSATYLNQ